MAAGPNDIAYVREEEAPALPPPVRQRGLIGWIWRNMLQSMSNFSTPAASFQSTMMIAATVLVGYAAYVQFSAFLNFALFEAVWVSKEGALREACLTEQQGGELPNGWFAACYPFIGAKWKFLIYGSYPLEEIWRVNIVFLLGGLGVARLVAEAVPNRQVTGVAMIGLGVGYGLLVTRLFGEPFGLRVGVQMLVAIGLLFIWLRADGDERGPDPLLGPLAERVIRIGVGVGLLALAAFSTLEASGDERSLLQVGVLRLPMIAMTLALLLAPMRWVGLLLLTVFPVYAFILLTGADLSIGLSTPWIWAALATGLFALGWAGRNGYLGDLGAAFGDLTLMFGALLATGLAVLLLIAADFGLATVETNAWGGLLVTLVVAIVGIVFSLPLGILLALGRRSTLPAVRYLSILFIEFWRGVPLITVLFMSSVMLPLFLPEGVDFNKLLRALIGVMLFAAAYQAEVVRGGLQAIPKGQFEGAQALGLNYWRMMSLIVLPQALTLVIPGIVNTFIGLFKDTSLVLIISLFDLLGATQAAIADNEWASPVQSATGYLVAALIFWLFCFGMSRYSMFMERKLRKGHAR